MGKIGHCLAVSDFYIDLFPKVKTLERDRLDARWHTAFDDLAVGVDADKRISRGFAARHGVEVVVVS